MAGKFRKFLAFTAMTAAACGAVYYFFGNRKDETSDVDGNGSSDFFTRNSEREYVSLNSGELKDKAEDLKEKAGETKEVIMNKLKEGAKELTEKARDAADGVGLVKDNSDDTEDFAFEDFKTEEDDQT
jgi:hypothetical protein